VPWREWRLNADARAVDICALPAAMQDSLHGEGYVVAVCGSRGVTLRVLPERPELMPITLLQSCAPRPLLFSFFVLFIL